MPSEEMVFTKGTIFPLPHQSSSVPAGLRVFCRKPKGKRSESAGTDVRGIQKAKTATDVVHVRQGKELSRAPFHAVPRHETAFLSGCGEGSPAPSALHMRVVLPISTSAGIACPFLGRNGLPQQAAWHRLFRIWRNIPEKRVEDGLLFGCITTKLYFCKK